MVDRLNQALPDVQFSLLILDETTIEDSILHQDVSLVLTDALQTSRLQQKQYQPILTLNRAYHDKVYDKDAGVLITLAKNQDIMKLSDVVQHRLVASTQKSLSFSSVWYEIKRKNPHIFDQVAPPTFLGSSEKNVIAALLNNEAEVGIVSVGLLEYLSDLWKINLDDFRVLHSQQHQNFPVLHSTALYPQWALSADMRLSDQLLKAIMDVLLSSQISTDADVVAERYSWQTAANYYAVGARLEGVYQQSSNNTPRTLSQLSLNSPLIICLMIMVLLLLLLPSVSYSRHTVIVYSFTCILLLLIATIFSQFLNIWIEDYRTQQIQIAKSNVRGTAENIHTYISQQYVAAQNFAIEHQELLQDPFIFAEYPPSFRRLLFEKNLQTKFPHVFRYAVLDNDNHVLYSTSELDISKSCKNNAQNHWKNNKKTSINIHYHEDDIEHFDLLVSINTSMVLIFSFNVETLRVMLRNAEISGQNLLLLNDEHREQIEMSVDGAQYSDIYGAYLDEKERSAYLYGTEVNDTGWYLEALSQAGWFEEYRLQLQTWMGIIFILIALILFIFVWRLTRETRLRHQLQESSQAQSNQRYKILLEHAVDAFISTDEYGDIDEFNPAAERMLGYDKDIIRGQNFRILMPEEYAMQQLGVAYLHSYLENQSHHHLGYHLKARHKHGYHFPVYMTLMDTGISGTYRYGIMLKDMTILKRSEAQLNATRERLQYALDGANEGYWDWDISSGKVYFSPSWENILGYQTGELKPHIDTIRQRIHPNDKKRANRLLQAHFQGKNAYYTVEYRLKNKQGEWVWTLGRGKVVSRDTLGQPLRMVGTTSNIQERKNLEHALQQSKEHAEKTAAAKSQFLSNMSHEIRTPLNGVLGMAQLLKKTQLSNRQQEYISLILDSGDALMTIINDILDLSKLESKQIELEHIAFDLERLLRDTLCLNRQQAAEKGIMLLLDYPCQLPRIFLGDPTRIKQIINNLVNNSLKFTQQGSVCIQIKQALDLSEAMLIQVIDTGIGIPKSQQQQIFKNFTQADNSTTRKYGGTGLGLAICKQLTEQMQGRIHVESEMGKGSCFSLSIPFERDSNAPRTHCTNVLKDKHILLFNDHALSSTIFIQAFESAGAKITQKSIQDSLKHQSNQYDVLVWVNHVSYFHVNPFMAKLQEAYKHLPMLTINGQDHEIGKNYESQIHEPFLYTQIIQRVVDAIEGVPVLAGPEISLQAKIDKPLSQAEHDLMGLHVLVVEDMLLNQRIVTDMLEHFGVTVDCVNDGLEGVQAWEQGGYDLILMDCRMPNMDGYAATREIRHLEKQQHKSRTAIFALTANALLEDIKTCIAAGMDNVITKPLQQDLLKETLLEWLKNQDSNNTSKTPIKNKLNLSVLDTPLFNPDNIKQLQFNLPDDFKDLIGAASASLSEFNQQIQENLMLSKTEHDHYQPDENIRLLKNLKSTALTLGLLRLDQQASLLEKHLNTWSWEDRCVQLEKLDQLQQQSLDELQQYLKQA